MKFVLPIKIEKDCEYYFELEKALKDYADEICKFDIDDEIKFCVKDINSQILRAVELFYSSKISEAVELMKDLYSLLKDKKDFVTVASKLYSKEEVFIGKEIYYKARVGETNDSFNSQAMLHIPFNLRGRVQNQRFSISGCPCIYLGKTSYVTWLELQKPVYSQMFVSGCKVDDSIRIVNLACTNWVEIEKKKDFDDIVIYPLIIATSFVVQEKDRCFHSEYIISQLFMQVVAEQEINGIAYLSKQMQDYPYHYPLNLCLAIIAKQENRYEALTALKENIIMSNAINYGEFLSLPLPEKGDPYMGDDSCYNKLMTNFSATNFKYGFSDFYQFDKYIRKSFNDLIKNVNL